VPAGAAGLTFTAGAFSGAPFDEAGARANLAALGRAEVFAGTGAVGFSAGASFLGDTAGAGWYGGGDLGFRWKPDSRHSVVALGELVRTHVSGPDLSDHDAWSGYGAVQWQPARSWYLGVRQDAGVAGLRTGAYVSFYTSEFLRARLGGGYRPDTGEAEVLSQLTFVWGSHPVEPWWVNR
jgi:hypothetical protein